MRRTLERLRLPGLAAALWILLPVAASAATLVIDNGRVHPVSGPAFNGRVVVTDGIITAAGAGVAAPPGATRIDASGLHVYPGLFDPLSTLGMVEINSISASTDQAEMGSYNPHLVAATAIHPASELIPVARANGITHTLVAPRSGRGGVIAGQATLVQLAGWTVEEMAHIPSAAMVITWPAIQTRRFDFSTFSVKTTPFNEAKENAAKAAGELSDWMDAARHYRQAATAGSRRLETSQKLAALARVWDGLPVIIRANAQRDIEAAVKFAERQGVDLILAGARDAWKVKEMLAEKDIPILLGLTQSLPAEADHAYHRPYSNPGELRAAGIRVAFASGAGGGFGPGGPHNVRNLPYEAAQAIPFGLSHQEALKAVTLAGAEILGVADRVGSIQAGRIAHLLVTDGSPLDMATTIHHLIIGGREVSMDNRHRRLYTEYRAR